MNRFADRGIWLKKALNTMMQETVGENAVGIPIGSVKDQISQK